MESEATGLDKLAGGGQDVVTVQQVKQALAQIEAGESDEAQAAAALAERVNHELAVWGQAGQEVALERVKPFYGDPRLLRWSLWCETCHVSQVALLARPASSSS